MRSRQVEVLISSGWLALDDAATKVGVTESTLYRAIREQKLHAMKVGGLWLTRESDLAQYVGKVTAEALGLNGAA